MFHPSRPSFSNNIEALSFSHAKKELHQIGTLPVRKRLILESGAVVFVAAMVLLAFFINGYRNDEIQNAATPRDAKIETPLAIDNKFVLLAFN